MRPPLFTVFTPTYNRAHTLGRVYESLVAQTLQDFEWLIVDDGSTDNTATLVADWQTQAPFAISYFCQDNRGKHVASNRAIREARGEFFLVFDSDDRCVPNALERFKWHWDSIPDEEKQNFSTISALCVDAHGRVIGSWYPINIYDVNSFEEQLKMRSGGERWGVNRTSVLRRYPFPEIPGETYIPEGVVWNRLALVYKARFFNEGLRIADFRQDGITVSSVRIRAKNPVGAALYYQELIAFSVCTSCKIKAAINNVRFLLHGSASLAAIFSRLQCNMITIFSFPFGFLTYLRDKIAL